jgi:hypothetical protein
MPNLILLIAAEAMLAYILYESMTSGEILLRNRKTYNRNSNPGVFWFSITLTSVFFFLFGLLLVSRLAM